MYHTSLHVYSNHYKIIKKWQCPCLDGKQKRSELLSYQGGNRETRRQEDKVAAYGSVVSQEWCSLRDGCSIVYIRVPGKPGSETGHIHSHLAIE